MPPGFEPDLFYFWLTGRLPPGEIQIREVMQSRDGEGFWLRLVPAGEGMESIILFNPENLVILRHVVRDGDGRELADIRYADYRLLPASGTVATAARPQGSHDLAWEQRLCRLPARITVTSSREEKTIDITLGSFLEEPHFTAADFQVDIPDNFQQLLVR
jgi:hypothetical protein